MLLKQIKRLKDETLENQNLKNKVDKSKINKEIVCLRDHNQSLLTQIKKLKNCYPRFLGITRRSCLEAHRSSTWSIESRIDLSMALEGPSFFFFIRLVLSAAAASITFGLDLYRRRLLLHEVIGPGIMVCVIFDHYNLQIYASNSFHF
jgi:hypothetical protein